MRDSFRMDFEALMLKKHGEVRNESKNNALELNNVNPISSVNPGKSTMKASAKRVLATMRTRVKCVKRDFEGKEGQEMKEHRRREHQGEF